MRWLPTISFVAALIAWISSAASLRLSAAEITLPTIDPTYTIRVDAKTFARERRGSYEVLAFQGDCVLKQGQLTATANEVVLWVERVAYKDIDHPGKVICYFRDDVHANWGGGRSMHEPHEWTVRLFSVHPVMYEAQQVTRYDIPQLDWSREPSAVQLAQFAEPIRSQDPVALAAPPLLSQSETAAPRVGVASPYNTNGSSGNSSRSQVPTTPGAVEWNPTNSNNLRGSTRNSDIFPNVGMVLPNDGSPSFPAAGLQNSTTGQGYEELPPARTPSSPEAVPAFPRQLGLGPQITRQVAPVLSESPAFAAKSVQFMPRGSNLQFDSSRDPNTGETTAQFRGGFKLVVQGFQVAQNNGSFEEFGTVSLEADNAVVWVKTDQPLLEAVVPSTPENPVELYLEGNIVFSQGNRVIYADRMYYNVSSEYGMVLSAEVHTPVPQFQGLMRLKADVLQQLDSRNFRAYGAAVTSSRLGVPRYWLQSSEVTFQDQRTEGDLSVFAAVDGKQPTKMRVEAKSNLVYIGGIPIFYWPRFVTTNQRSNLYLNSVKFKNDGIYGFQTYLDWDLFALLGMSAPDGTRLRLSTDYLSERGPAGGLQFEYDTPSTWLFGTPGRGQADAWFLLDDGLDLLGEDRLNLTPEEDFRGRTFSRHRFFLDPNWELMVETGWISDRDFLEQFFQIEWETRKDYETAIRLRRYAGNQMFDLFGQARVNDFFTETESLPQFNHFLLGQDLLGQRLTWNSASSVGYVHQRVASTPVEPSQAAKFNLLGWESDSEGLRAITRQELSAPLLMGPMKVVPFVSGEAGFWNEDVNQDDVTRLVGQAGVRTALPMWKVYSGFENQLLDFRGLAHKATFETEYFYADANKDVDRFPLFDPLDDNSQEHFRRRFITNTFGGALPPEFDERNYAIRNGIQRWVTSNSELMEDQSQLRVGVDQRWQTKRGLPGRERIVDVISLDVDFTYFTNSTRDNFGEPFGAINYDFRYHVGDRLTLLSDGYADVFSQGLKAVSAGAQISRPGRGDAYIGLLSLEGPISANILNGFVNYRMNEKWIFSGGAAFDFGDTGSIGQTANLTRIGESFLVRAGVNIDHGRDNVSFTFGIEPRFLPTIRLGVVGGELIPPAGLYGLE